jgi:hypothetical protein
MSQSGRSETDTGSVTAIRRESILSGLSSLSTSRWAIATTMNLLRHFVLSKKRFVLGSATALLDTYSYFTSLGIS